MTDDTDDGVSRRSVLRKGAMTAGAVAVGTVATSGNAAAAKQGGRAQVDGSVRRDAPFTIRPNGTDMRNASCMSANSAIQTYLTYYIDYCDEDQNDDDTMYIIPDEAELAPDQTYVIHSATPCRRNDLQKVAIGPAQESC